jgi:predicted adenine nucleotide alpha hydrolase (AANH) superfamily ATPase
LFEQGINSAFEEESASFEAPAVSLPAILLHSCCGPCSTAVIENLALRFRITVYYCNSNIDDQAEYLKRLESQKKFIDIYNTSPDRAGEPVAFVCADYAPESFLKLVKGFEGCLEGGERCRLCIGDRLEKTAIYAALHGIGSFSTTLSVSRHKNFRMISELGIALALRYGIEFVGENFRFGGGDERAALLARSYDLYRQNYCGCRFSKR